MQERSRGPPVARGEDGVDGVVRRRRTPDGLLRRLRAPTAARSGPPQSFPKPYTAPTGGEGKQRLCLVPRIVPKIFH